MVKILQSVVAAFIGVSLGFPAGGQAQSTKNPAPESSAAHAGSPLPIPLKLHYNDPKTFPLGTRQSLILSDFKCGADGSVFLPMMSDDVSKVALQGESPQQIGTFMMVVALTPTGDVVRFTPQQVPGYRNVILTLRYFVSRSHVYLLEMADKVDPSDLQATTGRSRLIQVFDYKGQPTQLIVLDPDVNPVNLAAFESGDILLFSVDELNHTTRLLLLDKSGRAQSELRLFDSDFGPHLEGAAKGRNSLPSWQNDDALSRSIALANLVPRGDNLLLALSQLNLPVLELNQHGVTRSTTLALAPDSTIQTLLPSDDGLFVALVGEFRSLPPSISTPANSHSATSPEGVSGEPRVFSPTEIDTFYPQDGSLVSRVSLSAGPMPVCAINGEYTFLAPRDEDGRLQVIRARPIR